MLIVVSSTIITSGVSMLHMPQVTEFHGFGH